MQMLFLACLTIVNAYGDAETDIDSYSINLKQPWVVSRFKVKKLFERMYFL